MQLNVCPSPALYPYYDESDTVIVVDVFRASTTLCAMLANGATAVIPVADVAIAERYKADGFLVGAERNARQCAFADFGNSPFDYTHDKVGGREVVFTTTNGTQAIEMASNCRHLYIGSFANIDAVAQKCIDEDAKKIMVLCAGWNNRINVEDMLFAGAFAEKLSAQKEITPCSDSVFISSNLWNAAKEDAASYLKETEHYKRLVNNHAEKDIAFCLQHNSFSVVPEYNKEKRKLLSANL